MDDALSRLVELEAHISGIAGDRPKRKWPSKTAAECFRCGHVFGDGDWIWRARIGQGRGTWTVAPVCGDCRPMPEPWGHWHWDYDAQPCETCSRPVVNRITAAVRYHTFCSRRCGQRYFTARQLERRRETLDLDKKCDACGERFVAPRSNAAYRSNACRQRGYRIRKKLAQELGGVGAK